jgi:hypothetical protein
LLLTKPRRTALYGWSRRWSASSIAGRTETAGIVRAIHVENAQPVEYGQLLFEIDPVPSPPAV